LLILPQDSLLAIIAGFSSTMIATNTILWSMIATIPCIVILAILGLELAVRFYRLTYLLCYYVFILKMLLNFINFFAKTSFDFQPTEVVFAKIEHF
jgi:hypothetical protein